MDLLAPYRKTRIAKEPIPDASLSPQVRQALLAVPIGTVLAALGIVGAAIGLIRTETRLRSREEIGPIGVVIPRPLFASRAKCLATPSA
jgi:hypothetical protein